MPDSKLPNLVTFLRSTLNQSQLTTLIDLLKEGLTAPETLDPELAPTQPKKVVAVPEKIDLPKGIEAVLAEMAEAYSESKFPNPSADTSRRVKDSFPGFIESLAAYQGRHLLKMLREKLGL